LAGAGVGAAFQPPLIALQAAMPLNLMATSTVALGLMRQLGATIGITLGDTIFTTELAKRLPKVQGYDASFGFKLTNDITSLSHIEVGARALSLRKGITFAIFSDSPYRCEMKSSMLTHEASPLSGYFVPQFLL
jgi:hypothetical protein